MKPEKVVRPSMSKARRLRIWERDKGVCYLCEKKVQAGEAWECEHKLAWGLSRDDSDENLAVAHKDGCHAKKTKDDVRMIAKSRAMAGETGQRARREKRGHGLIQSRPFPKIKTQWPKGRGFSGMKNEKDS